MVIKEQLGWVAADLVADKSWMIEYTDDSTALAAEVESRLDAGPGFALVTGVPVAGLSDEDAARMAPELVRSFGVPLVQGPEDSPTFGWLVRDEGSRRFHPDGSFVEGIYTSKSRDSLDIHNDGAMSPYDHEVARFALLCLGSASSGGESILISTHTVVQILCDEYPEALARLRRSFGFERRHVAHAGQKPVLWAPIIDDSGPTLRVRFNRQRVEMAPAVTGVALTDEDIHALDVLDSVLHRAEGQFRCVLNPGDLLIVDDNRIVHSREAFVDDPASGQRRCLVRVLLGARI